MAEPEGVNVPPERRAYSRQSRYVPPPCTSCPHTRKSLLDLGRITKEMAENSTFVRTASASLRYLECAICGRQWKEWRE